MSLYLTDDKSTLVQVMAWCRQATSHYLSQCWPDACRHMASLGHNELTHWLLMGLNGVYTVKPQQSIFLAFSNASLWKKNKKTCTLIQISLKFVPKGPIDHKLAMVPVMAWYRHTPSHYLNLSVWWPRPMAPLSVNKWTHWGRVTHICVS